MAQRGSGQFANLCSCILHRLATTQTPSLRWYAAATGGSRPRSTLRDDIGLDFVFGRHKDAAEQYAESLRDSVRERLTAAVGRGRGRGLDLESLVRLPPAELAEACRLARLQPATDPRVMASALHALLQPPSSAGVSHSSTSGLDADPAAVVLRRASWRHLASPALPVSSVSVQLPGAVAAAADLDAAEGGEAGGGGGAAATAALRKAAEREVDLLFDEELQRRLQMASSSSAAAGTSCSSSGNGGIPASAAAGTTLVGAPPLGQQHVRGHEQRLFSSDGTPPSSDGENGIAPTTHGSAQSPLSTSRPGAETHPTATAQLSPTQQHPQHLYAQHQQQLDAMPQPAASFPALRTTDTLAASARGPVAETGGEGAGTRVGTARVGLPYDPLPAGPQTAEVLRAARQRLSRMGYGAKDPRQLKSLLLLRRRDLEELVADFASEAPAGHDTVTRVGLPSLDPTRPGGLQSREQLAIRLLQLMAYHPSQPPTQPSLQRPQPPELLPQRQPVDAAAAAAAPEEGPWGQGEVVAAAGGEECVGVAGGPGTAGAAHRDRDADRDLDLGDPRRRRVLEAARRRRQLMAAAAQPELIASWLVKARAQDVLVIWPQEQDPGQERGRRRGWQPRALPPGPGPAREVRFEWGRPLPRSSTSSTSSANGCGNSGQDVDVDGVFAAAADSGARGEDAHLAVVVATGLSQRHAYACAEAVRYQIRERLEELVAASGGAAGSDGGGASRTGPFDKLAGPGPPAVSGVNGGDWLSLEAGSVQVHVLTPQARQYYRLEEQFASNPGGAGAAAGAWGWGRDGREGKGEGWAGRWVSAPGSFGGPASGAGRARVQLFGPTAGESQPETLETARLTAEQAASGAS